MPGAYPAVRFFLRQAFQHVLRVPVGHVFRSFKNSNTMCTCLVQVLHAEECDKKTNGTVS